MANWVRLRVVGEWGESIPSANGQQAERLFNLDQLQWWIGHGSSRVELQYASQLPVFVAISDDRMEQLTGSTRGYASD